MIPKTSQYLPLPFLVVFSLVSLLPSTLFAQSADEDRLTLLFAGDIMGHGAQIKSAEVRKNREYDYKPCFEFIAPILRKADLAIGNLEVTLPGKPPYSGYPIFRSPDDLARDLKWAGFDVLLTANNHANDGRKNGVLHTIEMLKSVGIHQTGTFKNKTERKLFYPLVIQKNGFKLAFLNYTYGTNNIATRPPTIVNEINTFIIEQDITKAKKSNPDAIIVVLHWGEEYQLIESQRQRKLAKWLAEKGVDLVIGAHPHVVQPIIEQSTNKSAFPTTLIAYSLGNFISNQNQPHTEGGILLEVELVKSNKQKKATIQQTRFIPIWRHIENKNKQVTYKVLPIAAIETGKYLDIKMPPNELKAMKNFARSTRARLRHNGATEKKVSWSMIFEKGLFNRQVSLRK